MQGSEILKEITKDLKRLADPEKVPLYKSYFKTGKGDYGEGDEFYGIRVPEIRKVGAKYAMISLDEIEQLLASKMHEERFLALVILRKQYSKAKSLSEKKTIYDFYLKHTAGINNWDLVDSSALYIVGFYLLETENVENSTPAVLLKLAKSEDLWSRRIAILSTFAFIRKQKFYPSITLSTMLLNDKHDLMHKAVGWMLREVANRDRSVTEAFLNEHAATMPRTMLRYAIEKFPESLRKQYMKK